MSKPEPVFRGTCLKGKLKLDDKRAYFMYLCSLEGKEIELLVRRRRKKRSKAQNNTLWGIAYPVIQKIGGYDTLDEVHQACKWRHLRTHRDGRPDSVRSTKDLSTVEFMEYYAALQRDAASGVFGDSGYIPDPGETWE